ncbi:MAG: guanylate kinase [Betaproteobacteria bacterium]|nr:guanylate kinase [Betaproteobacteria bacterium]
MKTAISVTPLSGSTLFIVTAPSGAGKSSLLQALTKLDSTLGLSISHTTRPPRPGEENGREYHFTTLSNFLEKQRNGEFLESAEVHGNYYGTSRHAILERLTAGKDTLLEIDWQGALQIKKLIPGAISIFILPPSIATLEKRLHHRGQDSPEIIAKRLHAANGEISHVSEFDYVIINDDFDFALSQLMAIIKAARCKLSRQVVTHSELFEQFGIISDIN